MSKFSLKKGKIVGNKVKQRYDSQVAEISLIG